MIDQAKIGRFLKSLRKDMGKTQEEIGETFGVSSRSVSRWENGATLPDLGILVELADYYGVDVRELIDGERKGGKVDRETKETLLRVADYAENENRRIQNREKTVIAVCAAVLAVFMAVSVLFVVFPLRLQYNGKGVSSLLCVSIDPDRPKEYVGSLDGFEVYTERMRTEELYFTTVFAGEVPLRRAVAEGRVSVGDWRRKAWDRAEDGKTEILRFENYEIVIDGGECVIRPLTEQ